MKKLFLLMLAGIIYSAGCDFESGSHSDSDEEENPEAPAEESQAGERSADQSEWDAIQWHTASGPSARGARLVMTLDAEITSDGSRVRFGWDQYPWSGNGLGHFFVWDGSRWVGGKYEWIRRPGQAVKLLQNIRDGYNGLRAPAPGSRVAFAWTSADGRERSNLAVTTWR